MLKLTELINSKPKETKEEKKIKNPQNFQILWPISYWKFKQNTKNNNINNFRLMDS